MKMLLAIFLLALSGLASASIKVPCNTDKVKVIATAYNAYDNTTNVKLALFEEEPESGFRSWIQIKTITYTLGGEVSKSNVVTDLNIKINVFRNIRICKLSVASR